MEDLRKLAKLIEQRNAVAGQIAGIINRPAIIGHVGEYIASKIFDIELEESAVQKGIDGRFHSGPLIGKAVNIKWYGKLENILDISKSDVLDYYLVMTGGKLPPVSSKGRVRPWSINFVFLFDARELLRYLLKNKLKIGVASSVKKALWEQAEIYPKQTNKTYILTEEQKKLLSLFNAE